jgi:hypothetical protein
MASKVSASRSSVAFHVHDILLTRTRSFKRELEDASAANEALPIDRLCCGWAARHQIWHILSENPELRHDQLVSLNEDEVKHQLKRFMTTTFDLHFPTAMSPVDPGIFSVLTTVYRLVDTDDQHQLPPDAAFTFYKTRSLSTTFRSAPTSTSLGRDGTSAAQPAYPRLRGAYRYGVQFSDSSDHILYHNTAGMALFPNGVTSFASTLAIFKVNTSSGDSSQEQSLVSQCFLSRGPENHFFSHWGFHPTLPLLVLNAHGLSGSSKISLWHFVDGKSRRLNLSHFEHCGLTNL